MVLIVSLVTDRIMVAQRRGMCQGHSAASKRQSWDGAHLPSWAAAPGRSLRTEWQIPGTPRGLLSPPPQSTGKARPRWLAGNARSPLA